MPPTTIRTRKPPGGCSASRLRPAVEGDRCSGATLSDRLPAPRGCAGFGGEGRQRLALEPVGAPLRHLDQSDALIEGACRIPVQDREIDAPTAARVGDGSNLRQQPAADVAAARPFAHEDVLDIDAGATLPGRIVMKEE